MGTRCRSVLWCAALAGVLAVVGASSDLNALPIGTYIHNGGKIDVWVRPDSLPEDLRRVVWNGSAWVHESYGQLANGVNVAAAVGADAGVAGNYPEVWVVGTDGNLWRVTWTGSAWVKENRGKPTGVGIAAGVGNYVHGGGGYPDAWVRGTDGNLWRIGWTGSAWVWENRGTPAPGVGIAGTIGIDSGILGNYPNVWLKGTDGNLWRITWNGSAWVKENHGLPSGYNPIYGITGVGSNVLGGSNPQVFFLTYGEHLWRHVWNGSNWVYEDLSFP
jgi:hypothetical protein